MIMVAWHEIQSISWSKATLLMSTQPSTTAYTVFCRLSSFRPSKALNLIETIWLRNKSHDEAVFLYSIDGVSLTTAGLLSNNGFWHTASPTVHPCAGNAQVSVSVDMPYLSQWAYMGQPRWGEDGGGMIHWRSTCYLMITGCLASWRKESELLGG